MLVPAICDRDHDFVDVGANDGIYSMYAQGFARSVLAFEPHPEVAGRLRKILNPAAVHEVALSDHSGTAQLSIPVQWGGDIDTRSSLETSANPGFQTRVVTVRLEKLDDVATSSIGGVKIDVEGHELAVIEGASRTLARECPTIIIECEERHHQGGVRALRRRLEQLGYNGYFIHQGRLRAVSDFTVREFQAGGDAGTVGSAKPRHYVNNFIFVHPRRSMHLERIRAQLGNESNRTP